MSIKKKKKTSFPSVAEEKGKWEDGPGTGPREAVVTGTNGDVIGYRSDKQPLGCFRTPKFIDPELEDVESP